jgi:hypothetical protein
VTGADATLRWVDDATLLAAGAEPWTELLLWMPPEVGEPPGHPAVRSAAALAGEGGGDPRGGALI